MSILHTQASSRFQVGIIRRILQPCVHTCLIALHPQRRLLHAHKVFAQGHRCELWRTRNQATNAHFIFLKRCELIEKELVQCNQVLPTLQLRQQTLSPDSKMGQAPPHNLRHISRNIFAAQGLPYIFSPWSEGCGVDSQVFHGDAGFGRQSPQACPRCGPLAGRLSIRHNPRPESGQVLSVIRQLKDCEWEAAPTLEYLATEGNAYLLNGGQLLQDLSEILVIELQVYLGELVEVYGRHLLHQARASEEYLQLRQVSPKVVRHEREGAPVAGLGHVDAQQVCAALVLQRPEQGGHAIDIEDVVDHPLEIDPVEVQEGGEPGPTIAGQAEEAHGATEDLEEHSRYQARPQPMVRAGGRVPRKDQDGGRVVHHYQPAEHQATVLRTPLPEVHQLRILWFHCARLKSQELLRADGLHYQGRGAKEGQHQPSHPCRTWPWKSRRNPSQVPMDVRDEEAGLPQNWDYDCQHETASVDIMVLRMPLILDLGPFSPFSLLLSIGVPVERYNWRVEYQEEADWHEH
mmetsp:Transcript_57967/g.131046  ORF Transcript_57967/g.131046 Transcript_57967/m.131046 type:complete len:518 (-) Transcript_57967:482-2035(-)